MEFLRALIQSQNTASKAASLIQNVFGVSTTDLATFLAVPALLATVAFAATVIPAWRATSVDPMVALREE
jgi:putative ABC transport system permease protein